MDENQQPPEPIPTSKPEDPQPQAQRTVVSSTDIPQATASATQPTSSPSTMRKVLLFLLAVVSGSMFLLVIGQIVFFVLSDIAGGALRGEPETGWGIFISTIFLTPIAVGALMIFLLASRKYRQLTQKSIWLLLLCSLVLAAVIFGVMEFRDRAKERELNSPDRATLINLTQAEAKIEHDYYANKGILPTRAQLTQSLGYPVDYRITDENKFQLCGRFAKNTLQPTDSSRIQDVALAQSVANGDTIGPKGYLPQAFNFHHAAVQCYTFQIHKYGTPPESVY